jgi:hypothetical protein
VIGTRPRACVLALAALWLPACDLAYPEVVVVNRTADHVLIKDVSFNGCAWDEVLAYGEATSPGRCLPGSDRVHFRKLDAQAYCRDQVEDGTIDGLCACDGTVGSEDPELVDTVPAWFAYQTVGAWRVDYGEIHVIEIGLESIEQDFSVPGPYGH